MQFQISTPSLITASGVAVGVDLVIPTLVGLPHLSPFPSAAPSSSSPSSSSSSPRSRLDLLDVLSISTLSLFLVEAADSCSSEVVAGGSSVALVVVVGGVLWWLCLCLPLQLFLFCFWDLEGGERLEEEAN